MSYIVSMLSMGLHATLAAPYRASMLDAIASDTTAVLLVVLVRLPRWNKFW